MADQPLLSPISCKRCRFRKVRCSRYIPQCDKCEEQGVACQYGQRVPRKSITVTTTDRVTSLETKLSEVLLRLERIEERSNISHNHEYSTSLGLYSNHLDGHTAHDSPLLEWLSTQANTDAPLFSLENAVYQMQKRMKSRLDNIDSATSDLHVEPEVAKSWIKAYFSNLPEDVNPTVLNIKLIEMIPHIMDLPNVQVDASIVVVYHCILYHGSFLQRRALSASDCAKMTDQLYDQCLRTVASWEPCATGTQADFNAAFFMVRVTAERFDIDLSWTMFKRAYQFAEQTGLCRVDQDTSLDYPDPDYSVLDASRKCFWELICMDLYFHLLHNKPLLMQTHWSCARVNLPWLAESGSQEKADSVTTIRFLLDSRRTFILMKFWTLLQDAKSRPDPELLPKVEALCNEIEALYEQWSTDGLIKNLINSGGQLWTIAGLALEGHACILSMLRHTVNAASTWEDWDSPNVETRESDIAIFPRALSTSRRMVEAVGSLLEIMPSSSTVAVTFTVFQAHVACACLAANLEGTTLPANEKNNDAVLLERVARYLDPIAAEYEEITPLSAILRVL